ncbi:glycoside hydrolase family 24 protein, partial [Oidiodendron maius Zn]
NCGPPQCNQATVNLISGFESFRANIYTDATSNSEIGYGHLCQNAKCPGLGYSIPLSEADGKKLLASDMAVAEKCITEMMNDKVTLNMNEYGALVSWAFNVGCGGVQSSTLVKRLNNGENPTVVLPAELVKWVDGNNGQVIPGLVKRRDAEIALSKTATSDPGLPPKC